MTNNKITAIGENILMTLCTRDNAKGLTLEDLCAKLRERKIIFETEEIEMAISALDKAGMMKISRNEQGTYTWALTEKARVAEHFKSMDRKSYIRTNIN